MAAQSPAWLVLPATQAPVWGLKVPLAEAVASHFKKQAHHYGHWFGGLVPCTTLGTVCVLVVGMAVSATWDVAECLQPVSRCSK